MTRIQRINQKKSTPGVIGPGNVGLPLAVAFTEAGFRSEGEYQGPFMLQT